LRLSKYRIGNKDVEAIAYDVARQVCKPVRPVGRRQIDSDWISSTSGFAYLGDDSVSFFTATAVVHENLGTRRGKCECAGAAHAARSAGDEGGFSGEVGHDRSLLCLMSGCFDASAAQTSSAERNIETWRTNSSGY
jgi:hypothetical protein